MGAARRVAQQAVRHARVQDQVAFEERAKRGRNGGGRGGERGGEHLAGVAAAMAATRLAADDPLEDELDPADRAQEVLHSATATMMSAAAREVLLSDDKEGGLKAYKERCYRKMDAETPEQVRARCRSACCALCVHLRPFS